MERNMVMGCITTKLEENIRGNGLRTRNKGMESCSMQIKTNTKDTG